MPDVDFSSVCDGRVVNIHYLDWLEARDKGLEERLLRKECIVN